MISIRGLLVSEISKLTASSHKDAQPSRSPRANYLSHTWAHEASAPRSDIRHINSCINVGALKPYFSTRRAVWNKTLGNTSDLHMAKSVPRKSGKHRALQMTGGGWLSGVLAMKVYNCIGKAA